MKKLLFLPLLAVSLSLYGQSKWSAGYRFGLLQENTFSSTIQKDIRPTNQVFTTYRLSKRFELEAALQHTQVRNQDPFYREYVAPMMSQVTDYKVQVFSLSIAAKYQYLRLKRSSLYVLGGVSGRAAYGYYESTRVDPWSQKEVTKETKFNDKIRPISSVVLGTGINYQLCPHIYLNGQATVQANNTSDLQGDAFPLYSYDPQLGVQIGFGYNF